jgi:arylsulfatase A
MVRHSMKTNTSKGIVSRRDFFKWVSASALTLMVRGLQADDGVKTTERLNVVVLVADDQGWPEPGCYGGGRAWPTPNIDRLAASGVRFTQAYAAAPVCSPTRASIMTGKAPARIGLTDWLPGFKADKTPGRTMDSPPNWVKALPAEEITLAEALREAGYATAMVGKWHLGGNPGAHGFDKVLLPNHNDSPRWFDHDSAEPKPLGGWKSDALFMDDVKTQLAVRWLEEQKAKPFFLYVGYNSVHEPIDAEPDLKKRFAKEPAPAYAGMQLHLDRSVGILLDALERLRLTRNTAVFYLSDNGATAKGGKGVDNKPLRGVKATTYEGGIRVPFIARVPGHTSPGKVSDTMITTCDIYPTVLELAGLSPRPRQHCDGVSFAGCLDGRPAHLYDSFCWHYPHPVPYPFEGMNRGLMGAIRVGDLKMVENYESGKQELFDLSSDVGERNDLAASRPEDLKRLSKAFHDWLIEVKARMPVRRTPQGASQ